MIDPCSLEAKPLLTIAEALENIRAAIQPVAGSERVALTNLLGRVLAEAVYSPINIPSGRNSAMDGYAFASKDIDKNQFFKLKLAGTSWAGRPFQGAVQAGECVRIFTGALLPEGTDSVVIQENVSADDDGILFPANTGASQNVRQAGEDVGQGGLLCSQHKKLTAADIGLLASAGIDGASVTRKINIAHFSTGDELVSLGKALEPGKIYDSNRYMLAALLSDPCYHVVDKGVLPDDQTQIETQILQLAESHDVIITSGGASVGDADYINASLKKIGEVNFWKIAIKPGKPLAFGKISDCCFFGLPGNPVSAIVIFQQLVVPALKQLSGAVVNKPLRFFATCTSNLKKARGRQEFQRGILSQDDDGNFFVASTGQQGSHILSSMNQGNCYIILPSEAERISSGEQVLIEPFTLYI